MFSRQDLALAERAAKVGAAFLLGCYIIGVVIVNFHLSLYHVQDFDLIRARYILTGFGFLVYLFAPLLMWIVVLEVPSQLSERIHPLAISVFGGLLSIFVVPTMFQYFIAEIRAIAASHVGSSMPLTIPIIVTFWSLYRSPVLPLFVVSWLAPLVVLYLMMRRPNRLTNVIQPFRRAVIAVAFFGAVSQIVHYAWDVHPNVFASVGGGHPRVATVIFRDTCSLEEITPDTALDREVGARGSKLSPRAAVVWHREADLIHLTFLTDFVGRGRPGRSVISISNACVAALQSLDAVVITDFSGSSVVLLAP